MPPPLPIDIVVSQPLSGNRYSTWSHIFQGANTIWLGFGTGQLTLGNFFLGLQGQVNQAFDAQIPPGATILSATMEMTGRLNNFNPSFDAIMNSPNRALNDQIQDPIQSPFQLWEGYRQGQWSNAQVGALSTTFTAVFGTSVTTNASWAMRQINAPGATIANRDHMAQLVTTRTGNMEIDFLFWDLSRTGNPTGNLTVRIQGVTLDRGVKIPDGVDVLNGVSNPVLASSIPNAQTTTSFTFPIDPILVAGQEYFILIEPEYAANNTDFINVWHQNAFLIANGGGLRHYGQGLGMDWQNFPGVVDLNQAFNVTTIPGEDVTWPIDVVTAGVVEVSPDITSLVQAQINAANYTQDSGIIIALSRVLPTAQNRVFQGNVVEPAVLRISYLEPVDDEKLADPASRIGRHRIVEPWDPAYYRWKYGKDKPKPKPKELDEERIGTWTGESEADIERPSVMSEMLDQDRLDTYEARNAQNERDIAELEAYILAGTQALAQDAAQVELEIEDQEAFIAQLEANVVMARDALIMAMEQRQKHQNLLAAIEAVIRNYY